MTRRTEWPEPPEGQGFPAPSHGVENPERAERDGQRSPYHSEEFTSEGFTGGLAQCPLEDSDGLALSRAGAGPSRASFGGEGERLTDEPRTPGEEPGAGTGQGGSQEVPTAGEGIADPAERARAICLHLLTGTPRTRQQLADALHQREVPEEAAAEVLDRFEEVGLVDDVAFADAWVESRHHGKGLARRALARELRGKGVDSAVIEGAVEQLDAEREEETARALVERKLRATRGVEHGKRVRRLAGMLARKGYSEGLALRVVRRALEEEGEDPEVLERHLPEL